MNHKIWCLFLFFLLAACSVELKDKNSKDNSTELNELIVEKQFSLPVPRILSQQIALHYDRLVLKSGAQFITQGLNLRLEIDELISDNGVIQTFPDDQRAPVGQEGRSGGHLELVVGHATGKFNVKMLGEQGGEGIPGKDPDESLRGPKGPNGNNVIICNVGGNITGIFICKQPSSGGAGGQGLPGFPGGIGFKGGDSGTALIKIASTDDGFELHTERKSGAGGIGGLGGAGGLGGFGGDPGDKKWLNVIVTTGPQGPQGPRGPTGNKGLDGYQEKICKEIADEPATCE